MAKARILVELRPDGKLLDPKFDGYKLSLEPVPIHRTALPAKPDHVVQSDDQYSFLHTKLFSLHNKLVSDPWSGNLYYTDVNWKIQAVYPDRLCDDRCGFLEVWEVPSHRERQPGNYNLSMSFASPTLVLVSDGGGTLHVVNSGDRTFPSRNWKVVFSCEPIGEHKGFVLLNSKYFQGELHCLLLHIEEQELEGSEGKKSKFVSVIEWITLEGDLKEHYWGMKSVRQLSGEGCVDLAALEPTCSALFVASDRPVKFISDSENPVMEHDSASKVEVKPQVIFSWLQKGDDITLWIPVKTEITKSDIKVTVTPLSLQVTVKGNVILEGTLYQRVDSDLTCWTMSPGRLEITLTKIEFGVVWPHLLIGCEQGEQIMDPSFVEEVHQRLSHLCSETMESSPNGETPVYNSQEIEDCDAFPRDTSVLLRLDAKDHLISHQVNLGGHQWLFNVSLSAEAPPAICVRHDVDACIWQMDEMNATSNIWPLSHVGTFLAFGYVQASKQQRKFTVSPSDMSYVAICDASRHVYVYHQPSALKSDLRHRSSGRRVATVAKQRLIQLESDDHMLGCQATNNDLFLLTETALFRLVLSVPEL